MIVTVRAIRKDLLQGTSEVFAEGKAIRTETTFSVRECPPWSGIDAVSIFEREAVLEHRGETASRIVLPYEGTGTAEVTSEYGTMTFTSMLDELVQSDAELKIRYRLFQGEEVIAHTELLFHFSED